jgi:hypothetical protein
MVKSWSINVWNSLLARPSSSFYLCSFRSRKEGITRLCLDLRYVMVASTPPAAPPAIKETSGDLFDPYASPHISKPCVGESPSEKPG